MIREWEPSDNTALAGIHGDSGLDYKFPDLGSPLFLVKKVVEKDGQVVGACFLRISCETILLLSGNPKDKMAAMEELQPVILEEAYANGIDDLYAPIFTEMAPKFRKRLKQLGWEQDRPVELWSRRTR